MKHVVFSLSLLSSTLMAGAPSQQAPAPDPMKVPSHVLPRLQDLFQDHKGSLCDSQNRVIQLITSKLKMCGSGEPKSCGNIPHGGTISQTKWKDALVLDLANCESEIQIATCNNGTLSPYSGTFQYDACQQGVMAPALTGLKADSILNKLAEAGLPAGTIGYEESSQVSYGIATRQSPTAGQLVAPGSPINVWLSKGSLANQDSNGDGIRDDIEVYLNQEYPTAVEHSAMLQLAKSSLNLLKAVATNQEAQTLLLANMESYYCVKSVFGASAIVHKANLDKAIFNSRERFLAFAARQQAAGGLLIESRDASAYKNSCQ